MTPKTIRGFAVVYALLFFVVIGSGLGAYATYSMHGVKRDVASVKASLGSTPLGATATAYIERVAAGQGLTNVKVTVLSVGAPKGDVAVVKVKVSFTDPYGVSSSARLDVSLRRGVWSAVGAAQA